MGIASYILEQSLGPSGGKQSTERPRTRRRISMKGLSTTLSLALVLSLASITAAFAQESVTFDELSASTHPLQNGKTGISFIAALDLNDIPIVFNYHWERSDGAKSAQKTIKVNNKSESPYKLVENWAVGPGVDVAGLWARVYVNSGNAHLVSDPIRVSSAGAPVPAAVPANGAHPAYLHALSDMRMARALLWGWNIPAAASQKQDAIRQIEEAIREINNAAISDGKNINDHPSFDATLDNRNRLVQAHELLNKAYADIDEKETNKADLALRSKALGHISKAREDLAEARKIQKWL